MAIEITLDAGHGRWDNKSPNNKNYIEGTQMWHLSVYLEKALKSYGFEVKTTRPSIEDNPSHEERGKVASNSNLFLSLHSNAPGKSKDGTYDEKITGSVTFYPIKTPEIKALAEALGEKVSAMMKHHFRGAMTLEYPDRPGIDYYGVIRNAVANGCKNAIIIEHGFHTNPNDSNYLLDDDNLILLAEAEAQIIAEHFGQKRITETKPKPKEWYAEAQKWAVDNGIADGTRPDEPATRAEVWTMLKRLKEKE